MKKITTIEKQILQYSEQNEPMKEVSSFRKMVAFWEIYDSVFNTNHAEIIKTLYRPSVMMQTCTYKSLKVNVSVQTLIRYRKMYLQSYYAVNGKFKTTTEL